jgi:endonuclease/exonuclease/phosphatase family metal-dependent hydrolase
VESYFVYGEPRVQDRKLMWESLRRIQLARNAPWVLLGDFNEALWQFEHRSKHKRMEQQMEEF